MNTDHNKLGIFLAGLYVVIFISLLVFFFVVNPGKSEFAGVYFIFLTLPWSIGLVILTRFLDYSGHPDAVPFYLNLVLLIILAAINSCVLYKLGAGIKKG